MSLKHKCQCRVSFCPLWEILRTQRDGGDVLFLFSLRWEFHTLSQNPLNACNFSVKPEIILCHLAGRHSPTESSKMGKRGRGSNICPTRVWRLFPFLHLSSSGVKHDSVLIGWIDEVTLVGASVLPQSYYTVAVRLHHLMNGRQQEDAYVNSNETVASDWCFRCRSQYKIILALAVKIATFSFLICFIFTLYSIKC